MPIPDFSCFDIYITPIIICSSDGIVVYKNIAAKQKVVRPKTNYKINKLLSEYDMQKYQRILSLSENEEAHEKLKKSVNGRPITKTNYEIIAVAVPKDRIHSKAIVLRLCDIVPPKTGAYEKKGAIENLHLLRSEEISKYTVWLFPSILQFYNINLLYNRNEFDSCLPSMIRCLSFALRGTPSNSSRPGYDISACKFEETLIQFVNLMSPSISRRMKEFNISEACTLIQSLPKRIFEHTNCVLETSFENMGSQSFFIPNIECFTLIYIQAVTFLFSILREKKVFSAMSFLGSNATIKLSSKLNLPKCTPSSSGSINDLSKLFPSYSVNLAALSYLCQCNGYNAMYEYSSETSVIDLYFNFKSITHNIFRSETPPEINETKKLIELLLLIYM